MARSRRRITRFLEKKLAGKQDLASPEDKQSITAVPRSLEKPKELENTSPTCVRKKDSVPLENQKQAQASESDLDLSEQEILQELRLIVTMM